MQHETPVSLPVFTLFESLSGFPRTAIPAEWRLKTAIPADRLDVRDVPKESGILSAQELDITESDITTLLANLASAKWSAVEVITAFGKRACIAQQLVNCCTEIFIEYGLNQAKELDAYLKEHGKPKGPLHGLPISLKSVSIPVSIAIA